MTRLRDRVTTRTPWRTARRHGWRYLLSLLIPVRMGSTYGVLDDGTHRLGDDGREHATWWQWRWKVYRHRRRPLEAP